MITKYIIVLTFYRENKIWNIKYKFFITFFLEELIRLLEKNYKFGYKFLKYDKIY